jgi:hypothetical protein
VSSNKAAMNRCVAVGVELINRNAGAADTLSIIS